MFRIILFVLLGSLLISGFIIWKFSPFFQKEPVDPNTIPVTLNVWGFWEEDIMRLVSEEYKKIHPNVTINYIKQGRLNYRSRLYAQINGKTAPDVFVVHNSWVPMFLKVGILSAMPENVYTTREYADTFYPISVDTLTKNGKIYGVPAGLDGLVMYVNEDILRGVGAKAPETWKELIKVAKGVTVIDNLGNIQTSGAALGTSNNIDYWSEMVGLLFIQQPGTSLEEPLSNESADVIRFYTNFVVDPSQKTWDQTMENSTQAFLSGKVAFYFAPASKAIELHRQNPSLKFKVVPVPQLLPGGKTGWGSFYAYAVSNKSVQSLYAWEFVKFLGSSELQEMLFAKSREDGIAWEVPAQIELEPKYKDDIYFQPLLSQGGNLKQWFLNSNTQDQSINDKTREVYAGAISDVLTGKGASDALKEAAPKIKQILQELVKPVPSPK